MRAYQNFSTTQTPTYKVLPQSKACAAGPQPFSDGAPHPLSPCCLQPKDKLLNLVERVNGYQETLIGTQSSSSAVREHLTATPVVPLLFLEDSVCRFYPGGPRFLLRSPK